MSRPHRLKVRVNDELLLDAGTWREVLDGDGAYRVVQPPRTPLIDQLLEYLGDLPPAPIGGDIREAGVALTALTVRWGSYYAVLADREKPVWEAARRPGVSRIDDPEMMRINIEASAALARLIDLWRDNPLDFWEIVGKTLAYLPVPRRRARLRTGDTFNLLRALALPEARKLLVSAAKPECLADSRAEVEASPTRVLANTLLNICWRNTGIENIHAGQHEDPPLGFRRVTASEDNSLFRSSSDLFSSAAGGLMRLIETEDETEWINQVLPYNLRVDVVTGIMFPNGWTLTDESCTIRLPGAEPQAAGILSKNP